MEPDRECSCAQVPTENGTLVGATWLAMHDQGASITCSDGMNLEGWAHDFYWCQNPDRTRVVGLAVWPTVGDELHLNVDEVITVTPVVPQNDKSRFAFELASAVDEVTGTQIQVRELRLVLDDHTSVDITVRRTEHVCLPTRTYGAVSGR